MTLKNMAKHAWLGAGLCLLADPAWAQEAVPLDKAARCLPYATLVDYLDKAFDERRIATAALDEGQPAELYASRRGTWTLVEISTDGFGCVHAYGERFKLENTLGQASLPPRLG